MLSMDIRLRQPVSIGELLKQQTIQMRKAKAKPVQITALVVYPQVVIFLLAAVNHHDDDGTGSFPEHPCSQRLLM